MCAAMNGMALHGGVIPYGGTFFVFSDYCRPSIRLAALMGLRVLFVMDDGFLGVGRDGARPADGVETAEAWELPINDPRRPSLLAFSRQDVPTVREFHTSENLTAKG